MSNYAITDIWDCIHVSMQETMTHEEISELCEKEFGMKFDEVPDNIDEKVQKCLDIMNDEELVKLANDYFGMNLKINQGKITN